MSTETMTSNTRTVVVTGASGGIGRAVAQAFAARGDTVALLARGQKGLEGAADDVRRAGGTPVVIPTDMADHEAVFDAARRVEAEIGPIDVWVNVAFTSVFSPFEQIKAEEYKRVTEVSYLGYVYATMAALQYMRPRDQGTIVQVGSALAYRGIPLQTAYCGAKHAIQGFHEALRCELLNAKSNVHRKTGLNRGDSRNLPSTEHQAQWSLAVPAVRQFVDVCRDEIMLGVETGAAPLDAGILGIGVVVIDVAGTAVGIIQWFRPGVIGFDHEPIRKSPVNLGLETVVF